MHPSRNAPNGLSGLQAQDIAVVIVAHGDRGGSGTGAKQVRNQALANHRAQLAAGHAFQAVTAGVLKGHPTFEDAIVEACAAKPKALALYPFFMADGYFVKTVIPQRVASCSLDVPHHCLSPLGLGSGLVDIIVAHACSAAGDARIDPKQASLLLVGHGSKFGPASANATRRAAEQLTRRHADAFAEVNVAFLEEAPFLRDQLSTRAQRPMIVSGFFNGDGLHAGEDVPAAIKDAALSGAGPTVYTGPVGAAPEVSALIHSEILAALANPAPKAT